MSKALPRIIWGLVVIVVLVAIARVVTTRDHHSADQKILIEKSK